MNVPDRELLEKAYLVHRLIDLADLRVFSISMSHEQQPGYYEILRARRNR